MEALPRVPASRSNPALPSALDAWFESMLVVDPDARLCQSAAALARTFVEAAGVSVQEVSADPVGSVAPGNEPRVAARPRSPPDARSGIRTEGSRARKSSEAATRARRMTSVLGSTAFLITTGAILALWLRHSEDPRRAPQHAETSKLSASSDAAARTVAVYFAVTPDQARLMLDGQPINNPHSSFRPADAATHRLHAEAPGYQSIDRTIMLTRDITIELVLSPVAVASPAGDSPARALQPSPLPRPSLMARPVAPRGRAEAKPTKSALSVDRTNPWQDP